MGRGKHESTKNRKEAKRLISIAEAEKIAALEVRAKWALAHPKEWLVERLERMLDRIDPLEFAAVAASTILVHDVILKADDIVRELERWKGSENKLISALASSGIAGTGSIGVELAHQIAPELFAKAGIKEGDPIPRSLLDEIFWWLVSFAISYYAFKHKEIGAFPRLKALYLRIG